MPLTFAPAPLIVAARDRLRPHIFDLSGGRVARHPRMALPAATRTARRALTTISPAAIDLRVPEVAARVRKALANEHGRSPTCCASARPNRLWPRSLQLANFAAMNSSGRRTQIRQALSRIGFNRRAVPHRLAMSQLRRAEPIAASSSRRRAVARSAHAQAGARGRQAFHQRQRRHPPCSQYC